MKRLSEERDAMQSCKLVLLVQVVKPLYREIDHHASQFLVDGLKVFIQILPSC
jgi:hypothetical protein